MQNSNAVKPPLSKLFLRTFIISACTFGGGFVIAGLMKKDFVDKYGWLEEDEMLDYVAIAQTCPGAIAVNTAILTGLRLRGFIGMIVSVLAMILPPMLILSLISVFYNAFASSRVVALMLTGMQAGVAAVILDVALNLGIKVAKSRSAIDVIVMILAFAVARLTKINVMWIVLTVLVLGIVRALFSGRGQKA